MENSVGCNGNGVGFRVVIHGKSDGTGQIPELEVVAYEKEDIDRLISFMMNNG